MRDVIWRGWIRFHNADRTWCSQSSVDERLALADLYRSREDAITNGVVVEGRRYEVRSLFVKGVMPMANPVCVNACVEYSCLQDFLSTAAQTCCTALTPCKDFIHGRALLSFFQAQVHRYHPPLIYGRTMDGTPETSTGLGLVREEASVYGTPTFTLITYEMPHLSARMVQMLADFSTKYLAADEGV